jgi:hypothetical protein
MFSIKAFGKLLVEPKTLGWKHSKKNFENVFEYLRVVSTPLKCLKKMVFGQMELVMEEKGFGGFIKDIGDH